MIYEAHMSLALNGSSAMQSKYATELTFDFHTGLPHVFICVYNDSCGTFWNDVFIACNLAYLIFQSAHEPLSKKPSYLAVNIGATGQLAMLPN